MNLTVVLADDHPLVRHGIRTLLAAEPDVTVVGETGDGLAVHGMIERLRPSVLIVDLMLPGLGGLEITREVSARFPDTRVIVLSMHSSEPYVVEAMRNGATGYVLKGADPADLLRAIRAVAAGHRFLSAPLTERAVEAYGRRVTRSPADPYESLTPRERQVLQLAAEGLTNAQIGARLSISPRTAEVHRAGVMRKLRLSNQTALVRYAIAHGIITPES